MSIADGDEEREKILFNCQFAFRVTLHNRTDASLSIDRVPVCDGFQLKCHNSIDTRIKSASSNCAERQGRKSRSSPYHGQQSLVHSPFHVHSSELRTRGGTKEINKCNAVLRVLISRHFIITRAIPLPPCILCCTRMPLNGDTPSVYLGRMRGRVIILLLL